MKSTRTSGRVERTAGEKICIHSELLSLTCRRGDFTRSFNNLAYGRPARRVRAWNIFETELHMARQMLSTRDDKITAVHSFLSKMSTASREIKHSFFTGARDGNLSIFLSLALRRTGEGWQMKLCFIRWTMRTYVEVRLWRWIFGELLRRWGQFWNFRDGDAQRESKGPKSAMKRTSWNKNDGSVTSNGRKNSGCAISALLK